MNKQFVFLIAISLVSSIVFGIIDSGIFLFFESSIQNYFVKNKHFDLNMAELLTGAISAAFAVFFANSIQKSIKSKYKIIENPFLDATGIIIGAIIVLFIYYKYKQVTPEMPENNENDSN